MELSINDYVDGTHFEIWPFIEDQRPNWIVKVGNTEKIAYCMIDGVTLLLFESKSHAAKQFLDM